MSIVTRNYGKGLGISERTVYRWVSHILERERATRETITWRLSRLGWTQEEIAEKLGVTDRTVREAGKNSHLGKISETLGEFWNDKGLAAEALRLKLTEVLYRRISKNDNYRILIKKTSR